MPVFTMIVRDHMSAPAVTAWIETEVGEAIRTMYARNIQHLPVVDAQHKLVGIVTRRDLEAAPAADPVGVHMTGSPHTTHPDTALVKAATKMRDLHVGALPVVDRGELVGIITATDIFDGFLELLGTRRPGTRVVVPLRTVIHDIPEMLSAVAPSGVPVTGLTTLANGHCVWAILNFDTVEPEPVIGALKDAGFPPAQVNVMAAAA
jgi:CBS domain-containing protein